MAVPVKDLNVWLGTGAAISGQTAAGYYIPAANVDEYIGNDSVITDDVRDYLYSTLKKIESVYSALADVDKPTGFKISRVEAADKVVFSVSLDISSAPPVVSLPTWA